MSLDPALIAKRKETQERVIQWVKERRKDCSGPLPFKTECGALTEEQAVLAERFQKIFLSCDDDQALAAFLVYFVGDWHAQFGKPVVIPPDDSPASETEGRVLTLAELETLAAGGN